MAPKRKTKALKKTGACVCLRRVWPCLHRLVTSSPDQFRCLKFLVGIVYGLVLGLGLYSVVVTPMDFPGVVKLSLGLFFAVFLTLGCAVSVQIRCISTLVLPSMFGKNGRSYVWTFAIACLLAGPMANILDNAQEVTRFISCNSELAQNQSKARAELSWQPVSDIMEDLQKQALNIHNITSRVRKSFKPVENEVEDDGEVVALRSEVQTVDRLDNSADGRAAAIDRKHPRNDIPEDKFQRKLDYRCEDVFSMGVVHCRKVFADTEKRCKDKLKVVGYILCLPLKLTALCHLVKYIPGVAGIDCDSTEAMNEGFGDSYQTARDASEALDKGFDVNMQYQMVEGKQALTRTTAEDVTKAVAHEFQRRRRLFDTLMVVVSKLVAFMFLRVILSAVGYHKGYVTDFKYDNMYITGYYKWIDARRFSQNKRKLLPLKKTEKMDVNFANLSLSKQEKSKLVSGTIKLLVRVFGLSMVLFVDKVIYEILDILKRHSRIDYRQSGSHHIAIKVHGKGVMGQLVNDMLAGFNHEHEIDIATSNIKCLPNPTETPAYMVRQMFLFVALAWLLVLLEAYGLRLRRVIASFFYPRREKRRTLFLYNDMLKKRKGFLRHARHTIIRRAKEDELNEKYGVLVTLRDRFPRLCGCLRVFTRGKKRCLVCKELETKTYVHCDTPGCRVAYCAECWIDIKKDCYACRGEDDWDTDTDVTDIDL